VAEAPGLIEAHELTKRFGDKVAVDHLSFTVEPGRVTGFLGPNGAGKSTTMRLILGLDRPQTGTATIGGLAYRQLARPLATVGALLESRSLHPGRSARNHLLFLAETQGFPAHRADEVLDLVGLREVAGKRVGGFSLGMTQRLGMAAAMLGDPLVLLLDEPVNGLDPEGIRWVRNFMQQLAGQGRTIFVSSHLMSEMAVTADHLIVIGRGRLIADSTTQDFIQRSSERSVLVWTPEAVGGLIRHTAGAIAVVIATVIVVPPLVSLIPGTIANHIHGYLPTVAGELVAQTSQQPGDVLSGWQGFGVFCLWTAVLLVAGGWLLARRDA
jgi:ABC-2 type transport system ATP-binding protein